MDPVRRHANFCQLTKFECGRIIGLRETELSIRDFVGCVGCSVSTIAVGEDGQKITKNDDILDKPWLLKIVLFSLCLFGIVFLQQLVIAGEF